MDSIIDQLINSIPEDDPYMGIFNESTYTHTSYDAILMKLITINKRYYDRYHSKILDRILEITLSKEKLTFDPINHLINEDHKYINILAHKISREIILKSKYEVNERYIFVFDILILNNKVSVDEIVSYINVWNKYVPDDRYEYTLPLHEIYKHLFKDFCLSKKITDLFDALLKLEYEYKVQRIEYVKSVKPYWTLGNYINCLYNGVYTNLFGLYDSPLKSKLCDESTRMILDSNGNEMSVDDIAKYLTLYDIYIVFYQCVKYNRIDCARYIITNYPYKDTDPIIKGYGKISYSREIDNVIHSYDNDIVKKEKESFLINECKVTITPQRPIKGLYTYDLGCGFVMISDNVYGPTFYGP